MSTAPARERYPHVDLLDGVPVISGTTMKVVELVLAQRAHGWSPEELSFQFPHLSMAHVHSALAYYWDHRAELDADIERRTARAEALESDAGSSPVAQRLAALKHRR